MYYVPAHPKDYDLQNGDAPDNAKSSRKERHLKLLERDTPQIENTQKDTSPDPSEIAAKILQLSLKSPEDGSEDESMDAAAEVAGDSQPSSRTPRLVGDDPAALFDIPSVYKKPSVSNQYPDFTPSDGDTPLASGQGLRGSQISAGPSFKALVVSTLLISIAGGGAVALGLPDLIADTSPGPATREVQTQTITPQNLSAELANAAGNASAPTRQADAKTDRANSTQIAKAKDRIRQAFDAGAQGSVSRVHMPGQQTPEPTSGPPSDPQATASAARSNEIAAETIQVAPYHMARAEPVSASNERLRDPATETPARPDTVGASSTVAAAAASKDITTAEKPIAGPNPAHPNEGTITASVNLRQTEDKNGEIIGIVPAGTDVSYGTCGKWWCEVTHDGKTGFVGQKYVKR